MFEAEETSSFASLHRIGGNLALDFANTRSWRDTPRETDHFADIAHILHWAREAGLVDAAFIVPFGQSKTFAADIQRLRDAIDGACGAAASGEPPAPGALATIRDMATRTMAAADLAGMPLTLVFNGADRILGPVAWAAMDLLRGDELGRLKQCPAHDCHWLFLDRSKNGSRRWCEMSTCGERAKKRRAG
jgi:predicted RNA-binding Zn ribbon-like protein